MGLFSAIASIFGGGNSKKAINQANAATQKGIQQAQSQLTGQQTQNTQNYSGYTQAGNEATSSLMDILGLNGNDKQAAAYQALKESPAFTSKYDTGVNTLEQNASATGGLRGGDTNLGLAQFGSGLLADTAQNQISNLFGVSTEGLGALGSLTGSNNNLSSLIASLFDKSGETNASAIMGKNQANNSTLNSIAGWLDGSSSSGNGSNGGNIISSIMSLF